MNITIIEQSIFAWTLWMYKLSLNTLLNLIKVTRFPSSVNTLKSCVFPELHANKKRVHYDNHHQLSVSPNSHLNLNNYVKHEAIFELKMRVYIWSIEIQSNMHFWTYKRELWRVHKISVIPVSDMKAFNDPGIAREGTLRRTLSICISLWTTPGK